MKKGREKRKTSTTARVWRKRSPAALRLTFDFKRLSQVEKFCVCFSVGAFTGTRRRQREKGESETERGEKRDGPLHKIQTPSLVIAAPRPFLPAAEVSRPCATINPSVCKTPVRRRPLSVSASARPPAPPPGDPRATLHGWITTVMKALEESRQMLVYLWMTNSGT